MISASIIYLRSKRYSDGTRTQPCHFQRLAAHRRGWGTIEVDTEDGTSIVWDYLFEDDRAAFEEAISTICSEGAVAFANGGSNVVPFKQ